MAGSVSRFSRFIVAITVAPIVGEIAAIPAAFFIDIVAGDDVTGGRWPLNIANVLLVFFKRRDHRLRSWHNCKETRNPSLSCGGLRSA
jgi:hypothetical protein